MSESSDAGPCQPAVGDMYEEENGMMCARCATEMDFVECNHCTDGYIEVQSGKMVTCTACHARGGDWFCLNRECSTTKGIKIISRIT